MTNEPASRQQVDTLIKAVEGLAAKVDANTVAIAERGSDFRAMKAELERVRQQVHDTHQYIHTGNGREALSTRMLVAERELAELVAKALAREQLEAEERLTKDAEARAYARSIRIAILTSAAALLGVGINIVYLMASGGAS